MPARAPRHGRRAGAVALATLVALTLAIVPSWAAAPGDQPVVRVGTIRVLHEDDFAHDRSVHRVVLEADGKDFLLVGVNADTAPKAGTTVRVAGDQQGSSIDVAGITSLAPPPAAADPQPTGQRKTAVVLFNFANNTQRPFTTADALARVFTGPDSVNAYYKEASNGALSLVGKDAAGGDAFGWYTIAQSNTVCDQMQWATSARAAAGAAGHDLSLYDNVVYVFPPSPACQWGGLAYIGAGPYGMGEAWSNGHLDTGVISHELGHNFGLNHASTLACNVDGKPVVVAPGCNADEYGDPFDVMGNTWGLQRSGNYYGRHPSGFHLVQAGLVSTSAMQTISGTGDYTLTAGEMDSGTRALQVPLKNLPGWYYSLDLRVAEGRFDDFPAGAAVLGGVSIRLTSDPSAMGASGPVNSYLLDATPETTTFTDAPLAAGKTFTDFQYGGLSLTVKSISAGVAVVHAQFDIVGASVVDVQPVYAALQAPVDTNVVVTFSAPVDRTSVQNAFSMVRGGPSTPIPGTLTWDTTSTVLTFDPTVSLLPKITYQLAVAAGALDAAGRFVMPWQSMFTTDGPGPKVVGVDPAQAAVEVPVDSNVTVTFEAPVNRLSAQGAFGLRWLSYGVTGSFTWNAASTVMTFNPSLNLGANLEYVVSEGMGVTDLAGNNAPIGFSSTFRTDSMPPRVVSVTPDDSAVWGSPVDQNVVITFTEPMDRTSAQSSFTLLGGSVTNPPGVFSWDAASTVMTFNPSANLDGATSYYISLADPMDIAGIGMGGFGSWFRTDSLPPTAAVDPPDGTLAVALDRNVGVTFSEPVNRTTAQAAFSFRKAGTAANLPGAFTWDAASTVMTFNPSANLLEATGYTTTLAATVKDLAGIPMAGPSSSTFTTGGQAPKVSQTDPADGAAGVAVDRNAVVTFSEPVDHNSAQAAFSLRKAGTTANLPGAFTWDAASTVMTFNPTANLLGNSAYSLAVAASVTDLAGTPMAAAFSSGFTTDAQGPTVVVDAASGATGVPVDRNLTVTFSEPVDRTSAQAAFALRRTGAIAALGGAFTWDAASTVMTFNPYANLFEAAGYTVTEAATVKDIAGNPMAAPYSSEFTTGGQAPTVTAVDPVAGAAGVAVDRNVVVTFSEPMERNSAQAAFSLRKAGTTVNLGGGFTWDAASRVMTFNPNANLLAAGSYAVAVATTATDAGGNPMGSAFGATFGSDAQGPTVTGIDPPSAGGEVAVDRNVVVTFSEPVEHNSAQGAFSLQRNGTPGNLGGAFTWDAASTVMTFNPAANLLGSSGYTVAEAASVRDVAGNAMAAPSTSTFSTDGRPPAVAAIDPAAGATGVAVDRNVVVRFSEPVERNSAQAAFTLRKAGTTVNLAGSFTWDAASTTMTFDPTANLPANAGYTVSVAASAKDVALNPMGVAFDSTFTSDGQGPGVTVDPVAGATGVPSNRNVVVTFSEPVDRTSALLAFSLRKAGTTVNLGGTVTWDAASTVMTFDPYANLAEASGYTVAVAATVKDIAGNPMAAPYGAGFTTGGQAPTVVAVDPTTGSAGVAVDRNLVVTFSEPMERNSAQAAFSLRKAGTTLNLGGGFTWDATSTVMTFNPNLNLVANTAYTLAVATSSTDTAGNALSAAFSSTFTADAQGPTVVALDPADGATGVAVDRNVVVTFSEPVDRSSAQAALALRKAGSTVVLGGGFSWNATSTVLTFNPNANLLPGSDYTVSMAATVVDIAANPMGVTFGAVFHTAP